MSERHAPGGFAARRGVLARWRTSDDGVAMLTVMALALILTIFAAAVLTRSLTALSTSRVDRNRQQALQIAEGGADATLRQASAIDIAYPADYATAFQTTGCEKSWALWATTAAVGATSTPQSPCPAGGAAWTGPTAALPNGTTGDGKWVGIYPASSGTTSADVVYGVGASGTSTRVVRLSLRQGTTTSFPITGSVLTNTDLYIAGSNSFTGNGASAHTNGTLTSCCNAGNSGNYTYSTCTQANCLSTVQAKSCTKPAIPNCSPSDSGPASTVNIPQISARNYFKNAWYVFCPNGVIRLGPAGPTSLGVPASADATPCTTGTDITSKGVTGFSWNTHSQSKTDATGETLTWPDGYWNVNGLQTYTSNPPTYYAYGTNVFVISSSANDGTVVAESSNEAACGAGEGGSVWFQGSGSWTLPDPNDGGLTVFGDGPVLIGAAGFAATGALYSNQYFWTWGAGGGSDYALISNDQHSPPCGTNELWGAGGWNYNDDITLTGLSGSSAPSVTNWLEL